MCGIQSFILFLFPSGSSPLKFSWEEAFFVVHLKLACLPLGTEQLGKTSAVSVWKFQRVTDIPEGFISFQSVYQSAISSQHPLTPHPAIWCICLQWLLTHYLLQAHTHSKMSCKSFHYLSEMVRKEKICLQDEREGASKRNFGIKPQDMKTGCWELCLDWVNLQEIRWLMGWVFLEALVSLDFVIQPLVCHYEKSGGTCFFTEASQRGKQKFYKTYRPMRETCKAFSIFQLFGQCT